MRTALRRARVVAVLAYGGLGGCSFVAEPFSRDPLVRGVRHPTGDWERARLVGDPAAAEPEPPPPAVGGGGWVAAPPVASAAANAASHLGPSP